MEQSSGGDKRSRWVVQRVTSTQDSHHSTKPRAILTAAFPATTFSVNCSIPPKTDLPIPTSLAAFDVDVRNRDRFHFAFVAVQK